MYLGFSLGKKEMVTYQKVYLQRMVQNGHCEIYTDISGPALSSSTLPSVSNSWSIFQLRSFIISKSVMLEEGISLVHISK